MNKLCYNNYGDTMDSNQKKFNLYVFLSTFSRNLIEVFIPLILYKFGYSLKEVILYYLLVNVILIIFAYPCIWISKKYSNRILSLIGIFSFIIVQILLNNLVYDMKYIFVLSFFYSIYRLGYWLSRRFYNLKVIHKKDISNTYSLISIVNQVGLILSSYVGSLFLDFISIEVLTIISIALFLISILPLYKLEFDHEKNDEKIEFIKTIKRIPIRNLYIFGAYESINVTKFLFALYLFIYVKDNYQVVGIMNLLTNLATIIFAYFYGKKINEKNNYVKLSIIFISLVYFLKANSISYILLVIVSFLEGISSKMYELSISKEFYSMSKKFEYYNYNLVFEFNLSIFRTFVLLICYFFINDLKIMIYFSIVLILISSFMNFKPLKERNFKI